MPQILREVGLRSEMDRGTFTSCAQRIAASGARLADAGTSAAERHDILDTAAALARYFVANVSSLHSNSFYEGIGAVPWVPATKVRAGGARVQGPRPTSSFYCIRNMLHVTELILFCTNRPFGLSSC